MPSALSNRNNYYTAHHRQSSQSQSSLPDQIKSPRSQVQSPNRSLVYLPSTTYSQSDNRPPQPAATYNQEQVNRNTAADFEEPNADPHDFYRQYQDPFGGQSPKGLHQSALRTSDVGSEDPQSRRRKSSVASAHSQEGRTLRSAPSSGSARQLAIVTDNSTVRGEAIATGTLRARKASFRDLVARFDSTDDVPPLPSLTFSANGSRKASPVTYANPNHTFPPAADASIMSQGTSASIDQSFNSSGMPSARHKRPLFGEVVQGATAANLGYGIVNARRRRGSEGSPMHSPNPMFPDSAAISARRDNLEQQSFEPTFSVGPHDNQFTDQRPQHRRANSDFAAVSNRPSVMASPAAFAPNEQPGFTNHPVSAQRHGRKVSQSRIPVSTRRQSLTSESGPSNPSSRAPSKLDHRPLVIHTPQNKVTNPAAAQLKPSNARRRPRSPIHIQSPGKQGRGSAIPHSEKSPSLRANIIAPPPKISPPLRSSRPRLPVSSATTAASRARMAEKFQNMAREQSDRKSGSGKARPPELSDIDLKARRLKITQALSRSREGQDLRASMPTSSRGTSRKNSIASSSDAQAYTMSHPAPPNVPALVIESIQTKDDADVFSTPDEEHPQQENGFPPGALSALQGQHEPPDDGDSPTLGQGAFHLTPSRIQTQHLPYEHDLAEASAVTQDTVETVETMIDTESQSSVTHAPPQNLSLLTSITTLREQTSASPRSGTSTADGQLSDHADEESVQIILRNTTYLDDDEAVAKGYRPFLPPPVPPVSSFFDPSSSNRESWTSSFAQNSEEGQGDEVEEPSAREVVDSVHPTVKQPTPGYNEDDADLYLRHSRIGVDSNRDTTASDAYTIVNIVLQQHSASGVVDQQLVDDIYHRIVTEEPELADSEQVDSQRIEALCIRELQDFNRDWQETGEDETYEEQQHPPSSGTEQPPIDDDSIHAESENIDEPRPPPLSKDPFPLPRFRTHKYKSSLDSAEDWANTSPSIGDWMKYAVSPDEEKPDQLSGLSGEVEQSDSAEAEENLLQDTLSAAPDHTRRIGPPLERTGLPIRPPSHSPPPPPISKMSSTDQASLISASALQPTLHEPLQIPRRVASVSQMSRPSVAGSASSSQTPVADPAPATEDLGQGLKRLKQRRHVLKELVDTEYSYERDLRVLCDIYMQTAQAALAPEDVKVLFGNIEQIQEFARDFLTYLKQVIKPAYVMERQNPSRAQTRTPTSDRMSVRSELTELSDAERDRETRVGQAFVASIHDMEKVYTDYIRSRHSANKRLEQLQTQAAVKEWLKECSDNSSDITNAWSLDALLVKPIQRITKYPLLLNELLSSTTPDHPDSAKLRAAVVEVTEINVRINEVKKHTELVDQVLNRKRKESDVRNGLTKAWGRRAEKLRQHVGINEMYEDGEYARLKMDYDNNCIHLFIVTKDCQGYMDAIRGWVVRMCDMAAAAEAWVDIGHTNHPVAESKLRQLAIAVRGISSIALPDHVENVNKKVIAPMEKCKIMLERFNLEPKGLIQKREKKLLDYSQAKNKKERGEKLDKKMSERMEQWEAINREVKERMRKLRDTTATLVQVCLGILVQLNMEWLSMIQKKLGAAVAIQLDKLPELDLEKEWQVDFDFQEASALTLGICNGSLLAEAVNMVSFLTPGSTTLNGDDSPHQSSWNAKRSISLNSDIMHQQSDFHPSLRHSAGQHSSHTEYPPESSSFGASSRMRAASLASHRAAKTPEMPHRNGGPPTMPNGINFSRPGTSMGPVDEGSMYGAGAPPRVSLDTPSPSLGISPLRSHSPAQARPGSSQTFFSAAPTPNNSAPNSAGMPSHPPQAYRIDTGSSSIFSSAMPLSDSPMTERVPGPGPGLGDSAPLDEPKTLFAVASIYEFNIDRARQEGGIPYLTYVAGEIFDVVGERGELWLARNQDDPSKQVGWIWNKHFAKLAE